MFLLEKVVSKLYAYLLKTIVGSLQIFVGSAEPR